MFNKTSIQKKICASVAGIAICGFITLSPVAVDAFAGESITNDGSDMIVITDDVMMQEENNMVTPVSEEKAEHTSTTKKIDSAIISNTNVPKTTAEDIEYDAPFCSEAEEEISYDEPFANPDEVTYEVVAYLDPSTPYPDDYDFNAPLDESRIGPGDRPVDAAE